MSRPSDGPNPKPPPGTTPVTIKPKPKPKPPDKRHDPGQRPDPKPGHDPKPPKSTWTPTPNAPKPDHGRGDGPHADPTPKPKPKPKPAPSAGGSGSGSGSNGLSRAQVIALQKKIGTPADGVWGPHSQAALITWQGKNGLTADGIPGPLTLAKAGIGGGSTGGGAKAATGGSAAAKAPATPKTPAIDQKDLAANYGWSMAVLNSDPELKAKFQQAVAGTWSQARFIAEIQGTKWYQQHGEAWRQNEILRKADPATYNQRLASATAHVVQSARGYGVNLTAAQASTMAADYMGFGWNEEQLRQHTASYASYTSADSPLAGEVGAAMLKYKRIAQDYGVPVDNGTLSKWAQSTVRGTVDESWVTDWAMQHARSAYPALQKRIDAGETISQIADPYKQSYAKVLEVNPDSINLDDRLIKQALQGKDDKGQPAVQTLWQFEDGLRNDARWTKTQNARDTAAATAHGVLQSFGLVS